MPDDALWTRTRELAIGLTQVRVSAPEDMLLHLAVHYAIPGCTAVKWLEDLRRWQHPHDQVLDWDRLVTTAGVWPCPCARASRQPKARPVSR